MKKKINSKQQINRIAWMLLFLSVSAALAWGEWRSNGGSGVGWFLAVSLWSAVCGIGYSVGDWLLRGRGYDAGKGSVLHGQRQDD